PAEIGIERIQREKCGIVRLPLNRPGETKPMLAVDSFVEAGVARMKKRARRAGVGVGQTQSGCGYGRKTGDHRLKAARPAQGASGFVKKISLGISRRKEDTQATAKKSVGNQA